MIETKTKQEQLGIDGKCSGVVPKSVPLSICVSPFHWDLRRIKILSTSSAVAFTLDRSQAVGSSQVANAIFAATVSTTTPLGNVMW